MEKDLKETVKPKYERYYNGSRALTGRMEYFLIIFGNNDQAMPQKAHFSDKIPTKSGTTILT